MEFEALFNMIANNGFAIFVAVYMIVYNNKTMSALTDAVNEASILLKQLAVKVDSDRAAADE